MLLRPEKHKPVFNVVFSSTQCGVRRNCSLLPLVMVYATCSCTFCLEDKCRCSEIQLVKLRQL